MKTQYQSIKSGAVVTPHQDVVDALGAAFHDIQLSGYSTLSPDTLSHTNTDIIFCDIGLLESACNASQTGTYGANLKKLLTALKNVPIVVLAERSQERAVLKAYKSGVDDCLYVPFDDQRARDVLDEIVENILKDSEVNYLRQQVMETDIPDFFKCAEPRMQKIYNHVKRVAQTNSTVLITGETGTGKTLLAQQIHRMGDRKNQPFISVHCGAIPETLLESELFGHEKGAFTGAIKKKLGKFDIARGGTIFLDEVGTISMATQIKLLQILQDQTFCRIGGEEVLQADVRIIAATNDDLQKLTQDGHFRQDLYFRLNVFPVLLPPLRERLDDLPLIVNSIIEKLTTKLNTSIDGLAPDVMDAFRAYDWPGNIRELENLIERALILEESHVLTTDSFPAELFSPMNAAVPVRSLKGSLQDVRQAAIEELERRYLEELLSTHNGKVAKVADIAGLGVRQVNKLIQKYGLNR